MRLFFCIMSLFLLSSTPGWSYTSTCESEVQAAGEDFATRYMDIGVLPTNTTVTLLHQDGVESVYEVLTMNSTASRIRAVSVTVEPSRQCKIQKLEALD